MLFHRRVIITRELRKFNEGRGDVKKYEQKSWFFCSYLNKRFGL